MPKSDTNTENEPSTAVFLYPRRDYTIKPPNETVALKTFIMFIATRMLRLKFPSDFIYLKMSMAKIKMKPMPLIYWKKPMARLFQCVLLYFSLKNASISPSDAV